MTDDYHPITPAAPLACPACHAWGNAPCTRPDGTQRPHHRSRGRQRVLTTTGVQKRGGGKVNNAHGKRARLVERDGDQCWICGRTLTLYAPGSETYATLDHVIPVSLGGGSALDNLRLACRKCNGARGAAPVESVRTWRS